MKKKKKNEKKIITTKKDFEIFKKYCRKWINLFGLNRWKLYFEHKHLEGSYANYSYNQGAKNTVIRFALDWEGEKITPRNIERTAFHEVFELFLSKYTQLAKDRFIREDELDEEIHVVVRTMENVYFGEIDDN